MKIIMLAGKGKSTTYVYNGLKKNVNLSHVLYTDAPSRKKILLRRIKNLGYFTVFNQLIFQMFVVKVLNLISSRKIVKLEEELGLSLNEIPENKIINVGKVNSKKTINTIKKLNPDVIIVNGTSIISTKVLNSTNAIFINTHVGITPQYRGVHGGYWALRNDDKENFGVTVHLVDKGIDTGSIIYQATTRVKKSDNFITYPLYQIKLAIPLLIKTLEDIKKCNLKTFKKPNAESKLYYHPTFSTYIFGLIFKGVK